jgi:hypothetical protein
MVKQMVELKQCKTCGEVKPLTEYYTRQARCKPCHSKAVSQYQKDNYERSYQTKRKYYKKKQGVYGIFSGDECLYVGESSQLIKRIADHKCCINNPKSSPKAEQQRYIRIAEYSNVGIKVLEETDNHKERELYWINKLSPTLNKK